MSLEALLLAARDRLLQQLDMPRGVVEVMFDGRPNPNCGDWFVAIREGEWRADASICSPDLALPEVMGLQVTVTRRVGFAPFDRIDTEVLTKERKGLLAVCRKVVVALHMRYEVTAAANAILGTEVNGFFHPLVFADGGQTQGVGAAWFQARGRKVDPPAGLARTLTFGGAQRVQDISSAA